MLMDFIKNINWLDILMVGVCARAVFVGAKTGFITEFFKSLGIIFSIFITLHYFSTVTVILSAHVKLFALPTLAVLVFCAFWALTTYLFKLIREGLMMVFSVQAHPNIDRWGGILLSSLRGVVVCGMVFYFLLLSYHPGILNLAKRSLSRQAVSYLPTGIYTGIYNGSVVKFFPEEKISEEALQVPRMIDGK